MDMRNDRQFIAFWEKFVAGKWFPHLGIEAEPIRARLLADRNRNFASIFSTVMAVYCESVGRFRWGEKTPGHYLHISELLEFYPDARIVVIFRDPRDVCASLLRVPFGNRYVTFHAKRWKTCFEIWQKHANNENVSMLRYEDLVNEPDATVATLCNFLGESFEPAMITRENCSAPNLREGWGKEHVEQAARAAVNRNAVGKWKQQLGVSEVAKISTLLGDSSRQLGYCIDYTPSQLDRWKAVMECLICRIDLGIKRHWNLLLRRFSPQA